ncbi:MAG: hypothetical protein ACFCUL_05770 [Flavobacteriaceae bacterium]
MSISKQKTSLFFGLSISATVLGALLNFTFWPLLLLGVTGMVFFHTVQLVQKEHRLLLDYARQLLIVSFSSNYVFSFFNFPYMDILLLLTKLAVIAFLLLYVKKIIVSLQEITQNNTMLLSSFSREDLSCILADLATVYIVIASLFKVLHWEIGIINSNLLLVIGLFTAMISILASAKTAKEV